MTSAPSPPDELERLAALARAGILDTPADPRFDSLVRLAAELENVPIALVSLVDRDRQWFKAEYGLGQRQTPRDVAFCAHAIVDSDDVLVVEDATKDPRFANNPLVTGAPDIRFYAGAKLRGVEGHALGTLCLIDRRPRALDEGGRERLRRLAESVSTLIELQGVTGALARATSHDPLTRLASRSVFEQRLETAATAALDGLPCGVLVANLDGFRAINTERGCAEGDRLLQLFAERLRQAVPERHLAARIGGDEFAVLLAGPASPQDLAATASRVVACTADPFVLDGAAVRLGVSVGAALCPADAIAPGQVMRAVDRAMVAVKSDGGGGWRRAGSGRTNAVAKADTETADANRLRQDLRDALAAGQLTLDWQPYFAGGDGRVIGHEALVRWHRPGHGAVSPSVLIPVAEACGLIPALDDWVLLQACLQGVSRPSHCRIAVNLSAHWFGGGGDLLGLARRALARSGLSADRLTLELTERTLVSNPAAALQQIIAVRSIGVRLALDDFGTGYSSLAYLRLFPFDTLKLDRSFVSPLGEEPRADALARAIISLGRSLGMQVCAEGIETQWQLDFLRREGCDLMQGYLLGSPAAAATLEPSPRLAVPLNAE